MKVKTAKGVLLRPVNRICCLEILEDIQQCSNDTSRDKQVAQDCTNETYITRSGRIVKQNKKYL